MGGSRRGNYQISRLMWTEQDKLRLRVTDLIKKRCEEPPNNNVQSSRTLIGIRVGWPAS
jgi:hypothetical protein